MTRNETANLELIKVIERTSNSQVPALKVTSGAIDMLIFAEMIEELL